MIATDDIVVYAELLEVNFVSIIGILLMPYCLMLVGVINLFKSLYY